ncbi:hypothetical protein EYF80_024966 [Liparis tanakae]|uniref:Uncharacterized protein n=1 Tax=Liparis tanakae TaxID=230148 RepID=A0A4Z2HGP0_9TELE|nr:hypothetical protein EYF80_024966 [Liparis tanakae]
MRCHEERAGATRRSQEAGGDTVLSAVQCWEDVLLTNLYRPAKHFCLYLSCYWRSVGLRREVRLDTWSSLVMVCEEASHMLSAAACLAGSRHSRRKIAVKATLCDCLAARRTSCGSLATNYS